MINSKKKGKTFERRVANDIKDAGLDMFARRSIMSGAAFEPGDLKTSIPFYIECKHRKNINLYSYWHQITKDVGKIIGTTKKRLVVLKKDNEDVLAVVDWRDFLELLDHAMKGGYT